ncbi:MAG TPA: SpoIIE family protein phosphatase [Bryobacteraceae bacterium]|nr:SpoIIE family protein phosphatase [Bryobacteraceae bacterium]
MEGRAVKYWQRLGAVERAFLVAIALYALLYYTRIAPGLATLFAVVAFALGLVTLIRLVRRSLWRLRYRLVAAYLLIAVVPVGLILLLAAIAGRIIIGEMAVYLVNNELSRRMSVLSGPANGLLRLSNDNPNELLARLAPLIGSRFPTFEMVLNGKTEVHYPPDSKMEQPPLQWGDANGLILRNKHLYAWVHSVADHQQLTLVAPISHELLSQLVATLGDVDLLPYTTRTSGSRLPVKQNALDFEVAFAYPMEIDSWSSPQDRQQGTLVVDTRVFAVLAAVFGENFRLAEGWLNFFAAVTVLFLLVELAALILGFRLSRSITGAVHELYQGTLHVQKADFSYRIPVTGNDQLAELSTSFNNMTDNMGKLIVVAKENERMQAELEIARQVQARLFPSAAPSLEGLKLAAVCKPALTVSGDYYDYLPVSDRSVAFAIGDVAGKGISAALLMAAIQSTMRTQLAGPAQERSTADLVATLNRQLYATTSTEKYATFFFAIYDDARHTLTYTNAGHLAPLLIRRSEFHPLKPTGTVVGLFPAVQYGEETIPLETGDILVTYTDGIAEPENVYGEMFGEERLRELLLRYAQTESSELIARVMEAVIQWTGSSELQDDMTMLVARRV